MAISIVPGRDFSINEIPTRAKLQEVANNLSITGIPQSQVNAGLPNIQVNDATSASNLPSEGWLWFDARGNLWGKTRNGDVQVRRFGGGWESNRFLSIGDAGGPVQIGEGFTFTTAVADSTNPTNSRLLHAAQDGFSGAQLQPAISQSTVVSSAAVWPRMCYRGPTRIYAPDFAPLAARAFKGYRRASFSNFWVIEDFQGAGTHNVQIEGQETDPDGANADDVRGHLLGLPIRDN